MSIERFFTTTCTNKRTTWSNESSAEITVGTFKGHIQQAQPEDTQLLASAWGKTFYIWVYKTTDVEPGDTITIASGDYAGTYNVKALQQNETGNNQHLQLVVIKDIA